MGIMMKKSYHWKYLLLGAAVLLVLGVLFLGKMRERGSVVLQATKGERMGAEEVVFFSQLDEAWRGDRLGTSSFTMGSSGCLTTCLTSAARMQGMLTENECRDAGELNRLFSEKNVYDKEGNIQWAALEDALGVRAVRQEAGAWDGAKIESLLQNGIYPVVRVRMKRSGNVHFVLIVRSEAGEFWCMDPMMQKTELVSLKEFGNRIYGVRYLEWKD